MQAIAECLMPIRTEARNFMRVDEVQPARSSRGRGGATVARTGGGGSPLVPNRRKGLLDHCVLSRHRPLTYPGANIGSK